MAPIRQISCERMTGDLCLVGCFSEGCSRSARDGIAFTSKLTYNCARELRYRLPAEWRPNALAAIGGEVTIAFVGTVCSVIVWA